VEDGETIFSAMILAASNNPGIATSLYALYTELLADGAITFIKALAECHLTVSS
jgi:hypothetical protein